MVGTRSRRTLAIALLAAVTGLGLLAKPPVGAAQSSREVDGARLLKRALDLHFHMDPWTPERVRGGWNRGSAGGARERDARTRNQGPQRTDGAAGLPPSPGGPWLGAVRRLCPQSPQRRGQTAGGPVDGHRKQGPDGPVAAGDPRGH